MEMCIYKVDLDQRSTRENAKRPIPGEGNWVRSGDEDEDDDDADDDDGGPRVKSEEGTSALPKSKPFAKKPATARGKKSIPGAKTGLNPATYRKTIPEGIPNCLQDVKILFTGTFETMDRVTSIATAKKYGGDVVTKLEDTDYIVVGLRAGPKKLQTINELELETLTEEEFFGILENGVSNEKRGRMANKRKADEEEKPEESQKPKKAGGTGGRKRAKR